MYIRLPFLYGFLDRLTEDYKETQYLRDLNSDALKRFCRILSYF